MQPIPVLEKPVQLVSPNGLPFDLRQVADEEGFLVNAGNAWKLENDEDGGPAAVFWAESRQQATLIANSILAATWAYFSGSLTA